MSLVLGLKSSKNYSDIQKFITKTTSSTGTRYYNPIDSENYFFTQAFKVTNPNEYEGDSNFTGYPYTHGVDEYSIQLHTGSGEHNSRIFVQFIKRANFLIKNIACSIQFTWKPQNHMAGYKNNEYGPVNAVIYFRKKSNDAIFAEHTLFINQYKDDINWRYETIEMPTDIHEDFYIDFPGSVVIDFYLSRGNPVYKGLDLYFDIINAYQLAYNAHLTNYTVDFGEFIAIHNDIGFSNRITFNKKTDIIPINKIRLKVKTNFHISPTGPYPVGYMGNESWRKPRIDMVIFDTITNERLNVLTILDYLSDDYENWKVYDFDLTNPITDSFYISFENSYFLADDLFFEFVDEQTQPVQQDLLEFGDIEVDKYYKNGTWYSNVLNTSPGLIYFTWNGEGSGVNQFKFVKDQSINVSISSLLFNFKTSEEMLLHWNSHTNTVVNSTISVRLGDNFTNPIFYSTNYTFTHPNNAEFQEIEFKFPESITEDFTIEITPAWHSEGYFYIQSAPTTVSSLSKTDENLYFYGWDDLEEKIKAVKLDTTINMMSSVYQLESFGDISLQNSNQINITDGEILNLTNLNASLEVNNANINFTVPSILSAITATDIVVNNTAVNTNLSIVNKLDIASNMNVFGKTVEVLSEQILIKDKILTINSLGTVNTQYGLLIDRGISENYFFGLDNSDIKIGVNSNLQKVAVRTDTIVNGNLITWNVNQFTGTPDFIQTTNLLIDNKLVNTGNLLTGGGSLTNSLLIQLEEIDENHIIASKDENGLAQLHAPMLSVINSDNFTEVLNELNAVSKEISVTSSGLISGGGTLSGDISLKFKQVAQDTILTGKDSGELYTPMLNVITSVNRSDAVTVLNVAEKSIEVLGHGLISGGGNLSNDISLSVSQFDGPIIFGNSTIGNGEVVNVNTPMIDLITKNNSTEVLEYINSNVVIDDNQFFKEQYIHVTEPIRTISVNEFGCLFTNKNSVSETKFILPLASESTGKFLRFYKLSTAVMKIYPTTGDKIQMAELFIYHDLTKISHCLTLYCAPKVGWTLFTGFGEWSFEPISG